MGRAFEVRASTVGVRLARKSVLVACRDRLGISRKQVADALGLEERHIDALEAGRAVFAADEDYERAVEVLEQAVGCRL